ncbi:MAG: hypothetical protein KDC87_17200, partial [Planctomycetes bacterium]|nr:hypothetical protein [Planctomycetota bacterium]
PVTSPEAGFFDTPALAVLPFATERGTESEYFADGLTEALIHELSEIPDVRVIARASVFHPQHANRDACNVGRDLGAAQVVCGRVRTFGAELEIDIELVRVADRVRLWGERYRHRNDALATAETEVLRDLVALLRARPATSGSRSTARRQTADAAAHRDFLRGRFFWNKRNEEALRTAIRHFRSALDRDPTYAAAYVGLADCYCLLGLYGLSPPHQTMPRAKAAAERALEIDGEFAEAFASLAYVQLYYDWDFSRAESGFQTALRLSPNYATAHHWYHELLTAQGRFTEQTEHIRRAEALDPLSAIIKTDIAWGLYFARDFAAAEQHLRDALELDPQLAVAHVLHGAVALVQGPEERAAASLHSLRRAVELGGTRFPLAIAALGFALARTGDRSGAQQALEQLDSHRAAGFVSRFYAAPILYGLGQIDRTLDALEDAVEERCDRAVFLAREPLFDRLRGEARFTNLLGRIGIA